MEQISPSDGLELIQPDMPIAQRMHIDEGFVPFSPDAFKENVEPKQPLSGGLKLRSPGMSPLGRQKLSRIPLCSGDEEESNWHARTPKRALTFGGNKEAKPSTSQDLEDPTDKIDVSVRENKAGTNRMLLTQDQSCAFEGLSLHEKDGSNQGFLRQENDSSHQNFQPLENSALHLPEIRRNEDMLGYDFSDDGASIDPCLTWIDPNIQQNEASLSPSSRVRPVLAELEGVVAKSPPSAQKASKKQRGIESRGFKSPTQKGKKTTSVLLSPQPSSPVTSPIRV